MVMCVPSGYALVWTVLTFGADRVLCMSTAQSTTQVRHGLMTAIDLIHPCTLRSCFDRRMSVLINCCGFIALSASLRRESRSPQPSTWPTSARNTCSSYWRTWARTPRRCVRCRPPARRCPVVVVSRATCTPIWQQFTSALAELRVDRGPSHRSPFWLCLTTVCVHDVITYHVKRLILIAMCAYTVCAFIRSENWWNYDIEVFLGCMHWYVSFLQISLIPFLIWRATSLRVRSTSIGSCTIVRSTRQSTCCRRCLDSWRALSARAWLARTIQKCPTNWWTQFLCLGVVCSILLVL